MVGVRRAERRELVGRAAVLEAAAGVHVGQDHDLFGRQDLRRLGHEAHAAKGDHLGIGRRRLARQIEAVADEIGEVLDFRLLVIMGEDHRVALALQPLDLGEQVDALQACGLSGHFCPSRGAAALRLLDRLLIWGRKVDIARLVGAFGREARDHLHVLEAGGEQRHREAALDRRPRRLARQPHRHLAVACLRRSATASRAVGLVELLVGVGQRRQHPAPAIFLDRVDIDVGPGDLDFRQRTCSVCVAPSQVTSFGWSFDRSSS